MPTNQPSQSGLPQAGARPGVYETINPFTEKPHADYRIQTSMEALIEVEKAHMAFHQWCARTIEERSQVIERFGQLLLQRKDEIANMISDEMGKRLIEAEGEVEAVARICHWCAKNGPRYLADEERHVDSGKSAFITYRAQGVIFSIQPWNFPLYQIVRDSAPKLIAGNTSVCKHAPNVWGVAELVEEIYHEAGITPNAFKSLYINTETVEDIIASEWVRGVSLTGSPKAGAAVAALAGKYLKKVVLELGGSDAYIILEDADVEKAATMLAASRLRNAGQTCTSPKRLIVVESAYEKFRDIVVEKFKEAQMGDPKDKATRLAPLARKDLLEKLNKQVDESIEQGARCLTGGQIEKREGNFFQPTVLENIKPGMPAYEEELFGPVALLFKVKDEEEAIKLANDSKYGLGGGIFTSDVQKGQLIARDRFESGMCTVNGITSSHSNLPFGGIKNSGFGREHGAHGFREFCNTKSVVIKE